MRHGLLWCAATMALSALAMPRAHAQIPPIPKCSTGMQCGVPSGSHGDCVAGECNNCVSGSCTASRKKVAYTVPIHTMEPYKCCSLLVELVCYERYACSSSGVPCTTGEECGTARTRRA